jgi:hypothetical protein
MDQVNDVRDLIVEVGTWTGTVPPTVVILNWKLLHKQVFRQGKWYNTLRHPRPA